MMGWVKVEMSSRARALGQVVVLFGSNRIAACAAIGIVYRTLRPGRVRPPCQDRVFALVEGRRCRLAVEQGDQVLGWEDRRRDLEEGRRWPRAARGERATVAVKEVRRIRRIGMSVRDETCCGVREISVAH